MWKRYVLPIVALASVAVVLAVAFIEPWQDDTADPVPNSEPTADTRKVEQRYLTVVYQLVPEFQDDPESDVIALGQTICDQVISGVSAGQIARRMAVIPKPEGQTLVAVSVKAFCPKYSKAAKGGSK